MAEEKKWIGSRAGMLPPKGEEYSSANRFFNSPFGDFLILADGSQPPVLDPKVLESLPEQDRTWLTGAYKSFLGDVEKANDENDPTFGHVASDFSHGDLPGSYRAPKTTKPDGSKAPDRKEDITNFSSDLLDARIARSGPMLHETMAKLSPETERRLQEMRDKLPRIEGRATGRSVGTDVQRQRDTALDMIDDARESALDKAFEKYGIPKEKEKE